MTPARSLVGLFIAPLNAAGIEYNETAMRADVYLAGSDDLIAWALENRVVYQVESEPVRFAPIEYVIVYKLQYFRMGGSDRHLRDIARMIEVSADRIDEDTLNHWLDRRNLAAEWDKAREYQIPEERDK